MNVLSDIIKSTDQSRAISPLSEVILRAVYNELSAPVERNFPQFGALHTFKRLHPYATVRFFSFDEKSTVPQSENPISISMVRRVAINEVKGYDAASLIVTSVRNWLPWKLDRKLCSIYDDAPPEGTADIVDVFVQSSVTQIEQSELLGDMHFYYSLTAHLRITNVQD